MWVHSTQRGAAPSPCSLQILLHSVVPPPPHTHSAFVHVSDTHSPHTRSTCSSFTHQHFIALQAVTHSEASVGLRSVCVCVCRLCGWEGDIWESHMPNIFMDQAHLPPPSPSPSRLLHVYLHQHRLHLSSFHPHSRPYPALSFSPPRHSVRGFKPL